MYDFKKIGSFFVKLTKQFLRSAALVLVGLFIIFPTGIRTDPGVYEKRESMPNSNSSYPFDAFSFISVTSDVYHLNEKIGEVTASASGIVVMTNDSTHTYILTAGHVCDPAYETQGLMPAPLRAEVGVTAYDYFGTGHVVDVLGVDYIHDLCLLRSEDIWTPGVTLSKYPARIGEKVYSIAAPHSIFSPGNALLFDGYFTGYDTTENAFFTIPTKPGSSGAGVFNDEAELIGIIHSAPGSFENLAIASSLKNVKLFLYEYVSPIVTF